VKKWCVCIGLLALLPVATLVTSADSSAPTNEPQVEQGSIATDDSAAPADSSGSDDAQIAPSDPAPGAPTIPPLEEVLKNQGKAAVHNYIPLNVNFRIGLVGDFEEKVKGYDGTETSDTKSPLILLNPSTGNISISARNFPAEIVANSDNGVWVIGVAPSASVEGTSGSPNKQAAVSLNMTTGEIKLIVEFPVHSKFQALFLNNEKDTVLYCVNEPGAVNQIIKFNLATRDGTPVKADGNRFYLYGLKDSAQGQPTGIWVQDPRSVEKYPVVSLLDLKAGNQLDRVEFPGISQVLARPDGSTLLASVAEHSEASLGYYQAATRDYHQIENLVFTKPEIKWTHHSDAVIVKETTTTKDRFLWVDVNTGKARELFSAYFAIGAWDISPNDDALVFIVNQNHEPVLFVMPLDPNAKAMNRIKLNDMTRVTWLGCLNTPAGSDSSGKSGGISGAASGALKWLDRLIPKF